MIPFREALTDTVTTTAVLTLTLVPATLGLAKLISGFLG